MGSSEEEYDSEYDDEGPGKSESPGNIINYDIVIHPQIIEELKRIEQRITELADGDDEFISNIVEYSLILGKNQGIYIDYIDKLIWDKYPNIRTAPKLEGKSELFKLVYKLGNIIIGQHPLIKQYFRENTPDDPNPRKNWYKPWTNYVKQFREVLEPEIIKIFYEGDDSNEEECSIIGNINEHSNNMEM